MRAPLWERSPHRILAAVCLLAALARCGSGAVEADPGAGQAQREEAPESVMAETLRALGHADWDPEADTEILCESTCSANLSIEV